MFPQAFLHALQVSLLWYIPFFVEPKGSLLLQSRLLQKGEDLVFTLHRSGTPLSKSQ